MICISKIPCPVISFSETNSTMLLSSDGQGITVFLDTIYNQDLFDVSVNTNITYRQISFYEYELFPNETGEFSFSLIVSSKDGTFTCMSNSLFVNVSVKTLRRASDDVFTMDSNIITTDGFIP